MHTYFLEIFLGKFRCQSFLPRRSEELWTLIREQFLLCLLSISFDASSLLWWEIYSQPLRVKRRRIRIFVCACILIFCPSFDSSARRTEKAGNRLLSLHSSFTRVPKLQCRIFNRELIWLMAIQQSLIIFPPKSSNLAANQSTVGERPGTKSVKAIRHIGINSTGLWNVPNQKYKRVIIAIVCKLISTNILEGLYCGVAFVIVRLKKNTQGDSAPVWYGEILDQLTRAFSNTLCTCTVYWLFVGSFVFSKQILSCTTKKMWINYSRVPKVSVVEQSTVSNKAF